MNGTLETSCININLQFIINQVLRFIYIYIQLYINIGKKYKSHEFI
jgi:hypothetical protein